MSRASLFIVSSGLGHVRRGFEAVMQDCFNALTDRADVMPTLYKGGGAQGPHSYRLRNLPRHGWPARTLGRCVGRGGYFSEQVTFLMSLWPHLARSRPAVVYVADLVLANLLRLPRRTLKFRIVLHNGGPTDPAFFTRWDHIHQVAPAHYDAAVAAGVPESKQTVIPCGLPVPRDWKPCSEAEKRRLREQLDLPVDRSVLLSVGAVNRTRKRMDYLVRDVAALPEPRPYLLVLGARDRASESIIAEGARLLAGGFSARSVAREAMPDYYRAADSFVLASLEEGFGLAQVEAMAAGLPCLAHDYPTARYVLGDAGYYGDFSKAGGLAACLAGLGPADVTADRAMKRHAAAYTRFSWERLADEYASMFTRVTSGMEGRGV